MGNSENKLGKLINSWFFGIILILAGVLFLFKDRLFFDFSVATLWPLFMLIPIIVLTNELLTNFSKNNGVIIPITILSVLMCHFLWHNFNGWENSGRTWPNYILAPGLGLLLYSFAAKKRDTLVPAFILTGLAAVFYATIINSTLFAAVILIGSGIVLLIQNLFRSKSEKEDSLQNEDTGKE